MYNVDAAGKSALFVCDNCRSGETAVVSIRHNRRFPMSVRITQRTVQITSVQTGDVR